MRAFVRYDSKGIIVPSSFVMKTNKPKVGNWVEISSTKSLTGQPLDSSRASKYLRAFVRYNGKNKIVPGSIVVRANVPTGNWTEITYNLSRPVNSILRKINIQGNGNTIPPGSTTVSTTDGTDFGIVPQNTGSVKTYRIQNTGTEDLEVSSIDIIGADALNFTISSITLPVTLIPKQEVTFNLNFISATPSTKEATIRVNSNASFNNVYTFAVGAVVNPIVIFNSNSGVGTMVNQVIPEGSTEALTANSFTLADSTFTDWNTEIGGTGTSYADQAQYTIGSENVTLYAQWFSTLTPFITTWQIGASNGVQFPLTAVGGANMTIDWGDGTIETGLGDNPVHFYSTQGAFNISVTGTYDRVHLRQTNYQELRIVSIEQWGITQWSTMNSAFYACSNLQGNATDTPDLSNVTDMQYMFNGAPLFTQNINNWDVSNVTDMGSLFRDTPYNQPLNNWDVSNVTNMSGMFNPSNYTTTFNQDISSWDVSSVINMAGMFLSNDDFNQDISSWNVSNVQNMYAMFNASIAFNQDLSTWDVAKVLDCRLFYQGVNWILPQPNFPVCCGDDSCTYPTTFLTTWQTTVNNETITFPITAVGDTNLTINWGDGVGFSSNSGNNPSYTYATAGTYQILISGSRQSIYDGYFTVNFNNTGSKLNIISIDQWGATPYSTMANAFYGCSNLQGNAIDVPDLSSVTDMSSMFYNATSFNQDLSSWSVNGVTSCGNFSQNTPQWTEPKPTFTNCTP